MDFRAAIGSIPTILARVPVPTPEWEPIDGQLFVRVLTAAERVEWSDMATDDKGRALPKYMALLVAFAACDSGGGQAFTLADVDWLQKQNGNVVKRIYDAAADLNEMTERRKAETEKNSEAGQTSEST